MLCIVFQLLVVSEDGLRLVPEIYSVPTDKVEEEYRNPGSQKRVAGGRLPFMWAQSLYIVGRLLQDVSNVWRCTSSVAKHFVYRCSPPGRYWMGYRCRLGSLGNSSTPSRICDPWGSVSQNYT